MNQGKCTYLLIKLNLLEPEFVNKYIFKECNQKCKKIIYNKLFQTNILQIVRNELIEQMKSITKILKTYDSNFAKMFESKLIICEIIPPERLDAYLIHSN